MDHKTVIWQQPKAEADDRDLVQALWRGSKLHCPQCDKGKLFTRYLKVTPTCSECGTDYTPQRSDDLPAYLVLFIVGHIVVGGMMSAEMHYDWPVLWHMVIWPVLCVVLTLALLPPVKGAVVAMQWALKMHGFSKYPDGDDQPVLRPVETHNDALTRPSL